MEGANLVSPGANAHQERNRGPMPDGRGKGLPKIRVDEDVSLARGRGEETEPWFSSAAGDVCGAVPLGLGDAAFAGADEVWDGA